MNRTIARMRREVRVLRAIASLTAGHVHFGKRPTIQDWAPVIHNEGSIVIGERVVMSGAEARILFRTVGSGKLTIGANVEINSGVTLVACLEVIIGDSVKIGSFATISDTAGHEMTAGDGIRLQRVRIGNNVWIGRSAFIFPGVTVGSNAIIGAGSMVTKDVQPNTVVAGSPARFVRSLPPSTSYRT